MLRNPLRLHAHAKTAGLKMHLRIRSGSCGSSVAQQERERPVLAAESRPSAASCVGDRTRLVEAIKLHIGAAAQTNIGNHSSLLGDVDGQHPDRSHRRNARTLHWSGPRSRGRLASLRPSDSMLTGARVGAGFIADTGATVAVYSWLLIKPFCTSRFASRAFASSGVVARLIIATSPEVRIPFA